MSTLSLEKRKNWLGMQSSGATLAAATMRCQDPERKKQEKSDPELQNII